MHLFAGTILGRYTVSYYRCESCGLIQTEDPYWIDEAYESAIASLDLGYVSRNITNSTRISRIIETCFDPAGRFLDYGAGYGLFVRIMRDKGYDFHGFDKYSQSIFADAFTYVGYASLQEVKFEAVTAYEVLEHLVNPVREIGQMLSTSSSLIFTTLLVPDRVPTSIDEWWYFVPETGQHVVFWTEQALRRVASRFGLRLFTNGKDLHVITDQALKPNILMEQRGKLAKAVRRIAKRLNLRLVSKPSANRPSLLSEDFEMVRARLRDSYGKRTQ